MPSIPQVESPDASDWPRLHGQHVFLRPLLPADYPMLQTLEHRGDTPLRWRFRGQTPHPEHWMSDLWDGVLAQFLVLEQESNRVVGLARLDRASFIDGHAYLSALRFESESRSPAMMLGLALFVEYTFRCWPFKALFLEVPGFNLDQIKSGLGRLLTVEGQLRDYIFSMDRYWDLYILSLRRSTWRTASARVLRFELGSPELVRESR